MAQAVPDPTQELRRHTQEATPQLPGNDAAAEQPRYALESRRNKLGRSMTVQKELERDLREILQRIVGIADPDKVILFGSAARGDVTPNSDIDLLIIKEGVAHRGRLTRSS